jgi:hypothetical protein
MYKIFVKAGLVSAIKGELMDVMKKREEME